MVKTGLQQEEIVDKLILSGSLALPAKNVGGINMFYDSNTKDGILSGKLTRPKYKEEELKKSVDTRIFELIPVEPPQPEDTVLRRIYNPVTQSVIDLTAEVERLNAEIVDLNGKIAALEIVSESLRVDVDSTKILAASFENQLFQSNTRVQSGVLDLQNSIQKGTAEAIQRVSLTARNQSLKEQVDSLNEIFNGKQAKQAEGAQVGMDISVRVLKKTKPDEPDLYLTSDSTANGNCGWENGPEIEVYNFAKEDATVTFKVSKDDFITAPAGFTLKPKEKKIVKIDFNAGSVNSRKPTGAIGFSGDTTHEMSLQVITTNSSINLSAKLFKKAVGAGRAVLGFLGGLFSDVRLKENIIKITEIDGIGIYQYNYIGKPDEIHGGVIAQELLETKYSNCVFIDEESGYYKVDYEKLLKNQIFVDGFKEL